MNHELYEQGSPSGALCTSVIVCTHHRPQQLESCLRALLRQTTAPTEIIIVDNGASDDRALRIANAYGAQLVVEPKRGLSRARNAGIRRASGDVLLFTDDDAEPEPGWVEHMLAEFSDPEVIAVAGRVTALDDGSSESQKLARAAGYPLGGDARVVIDNHDPEWPERIAFGGVVKGANMAIRSSTLQYWSGFDTRLGRGAAIDGCEEPYAFLQLLRGGGRIIYTPLAKVRHPYPVDNQVIVSRMLRDDSISVAYLFLLLARENEIRWRLLSYALRAAFGKAHPTKAPGQWIPPVGRGRRWWARLLGLPLFLRAIFDPRHKTTT